MNSFALLIFAFLTGSLGLETTPNASQVLDPSQLSCLYSTCSFPQSDCIWDEVLPDTGIDYPNTLEFDAYNHSDLAVSFDCIPEALDNQPDDDGKLRGGARTYPVKDNNGKEKFRVKSRPYPASGSLFERPSGSPSPKSTNAFKMSDQLCGETEIAAFDQTLLSRKDKSKNWATEHVVELQYVPAFLEFLFLGRLPTGVTIIAPYSVSALRANWDSASLRANVRVPGSKFSSQIPNSLVFECLGSNTRPGSLLLVEKALNSRKAKCFSRNPSKPRPVSESTFDYWLDEAIRDPKNNTDGPLQGIREVVAIWAYLGNREVIAAIDDVQGCLSTVMTSIETLNPAFSGLKKYWIMFDTAYWDASVKHCKSSVNSLITTARTKYDEAYQAGTPDVAPVYPRVLSTLDDLATDLGKLYKRPNKPPT